MSAPRPWSAKSVDPGDVLCLLAVFGLPWLFGGVGLAASRAAAALVALAAGWSLARRGAEALGLHRRALWLAPAFLLGAWAFVQVVPLPRNLVGALSPRAAAIQADAFGRGAQDGDAWLRQIESAARERVPEAADAPVASDRLAVVGDAAPPRLFRFSMQPDFTLERAFWYAALLLAFLFVSMRTVDPERAEVYRVTMFSLFGTLAVIGLANRLTAPGSMLWVAAVPDESRPMGPYINPSHFAGAMELGVPWMLGYGLEPFARRHRAERLAAPRILALLGATVGLGAALVAASKTAAVTIGLSSAILVWVAVRRGRSGRRLVLGILGAILLFVAVAFTGPLRGRVLDFMAVYQGEVSHTDRTVMWTSGVALVKDYPLVGSGFGAFRHVVSPYLPAGDPKHWLQMHNDYLEVLAAGGILAAILVVWLAIGYAIRLARAVRLESHEGRLLSALGLALGVASMAAHEVVDFNLQIPANALLFVVTAAYGVAPAARMGDGA